MDDPRFQKFLKDPRSRNIPRNVKKIKVDKRFQNMFNKKNFKGGSSLDERGRKLELTSSENLKKLYNYESGESNSDEDNEIVEKVERKIKTKKPTKSKTQEPEVSSETNSDEDNEIVEKVKRKFNTEKPTNSKEQESEFSSETNSDEDNEMFEKVEKNIKTGEPTKSKVQGSEISKKHKKSFKNKAMNNSYDQESDNQANVKVSPKNQKKEIIKEKEETEESEDSDEEESDAEKQEDSSEESEDEDSDESENSGDDVSDKIGEFDHRWEEMQNEAPDTNEITNRLAICNMDWDRIRADDLFTVFNSFKPPDGVIHSVRIYPSEFGAKRIEDEKLSGPLELIEQTLEPDEEEDDSKKGSKYHIEKLRQYQLNRLKYFYAVAEFDTPKTADVLYEQLNGMEYESSSVRLDLRFIPDDVTFDQEPISEAIKPPDPTEYKPRLFVTSALQQVKVNLTWDETDPKRRETLQKAFTEPESIEKDIKSYLASSSGESEVDQSGDEDNEEGQKISFNERIAKYKALLQSFEEKNKKEEDKYEMEITWNPDLKEKTEEIVKHKMEETDNPFDEIIKKQKERKLKKKGEKTASKNQDFASGSESDTPTENDDSKMIEENSSKIDELYLLSDSRKLVNKPQEKSHKRKKDKKINNAKVTDFKVNVNDPRFSAIYSSHEFNIDPSDPHFKETEGTLAFVQEKQNRLKNKEPPMNSTSKNKKRKYMQ